MQGLLIRVKGKGQKFRQLPISVEGRKVLYMFNRRKTVHYIFATDSGSPLSVRNALRDVKTLCRQVGVTGVR
jgi:site-specific recombinase XerD